jgi:hypothetical protein
MAVTGRYGLDPTWDDGLAFGSITLTEIAVIRRHNGAPALMSPRRQLVGSDRRRRQGTLVRLDRRSTW